VDTVVCTPDDGWKYHPKHVEQFPDINKMCNVASCWIYIEILLGAHPILHISRIRVKEVAYKSVIGILIKSVNMRANRILCALGLSMSVTEPTFFKFTIAPCQQLLY
jgi:hypothetical protein